jgi:hypothetical protein
MLPAFKLLTLDMSHLLYEPDEVITHIYFPLTAVTSVLSEMEDGTTVEVATIGREGMVGLSVFLGGETTFLRTIAQIPGMALSMNGRIFWVWLKIPAAIFNRFSSATHKPCSLRLPSSRLVIDRTTWKSAVRGGF